MLIHITSYFFLTDGYHIHYCIIDSRDGSALCAFKYKAGIGSIVPIITANLHANLNYFNDPENRAYIFRDLKTISKFK